MRKWDVRSKGCAATLQLQQPVHVVAEEPQGVLLVAGDECGSLTLFDARKPAVQLAHLRSLHHDAVKAIAFPAQGEGCLQQSDPQARGMHAHGRAQPPQQPRSTTRNSGAGKGALVASAGDDGRICIIPQGEFSAGR